MFVTFDTDARATYVQVSSAPIQRTVEVSDSVMVDVDALDQPVGAEFLMLPEKITEGLVAKVVDRFPSLAKLQDMDAWLRTPA